MTFSNAPSSSRRPAGIALVALLATVSGIGCLGGGEDRTHSETLGSAVTGPGYGVDYSDARPSPDSLVADGYQFVVRYLSNSTSGKNLSASEEEALIAAGLDVAVVWEQGAEDALSGYDLGVSDAQSAASQALADGQPSTRPIYFAIDFDATAAQEATIEQYFDGVASVIGLDRTGAYGGYGVIDRLFNDGKITWGWQTYAWSSGEWDTRAQLRQIQNGTDTDTDQAMVADFGQWGPGTINPGGPPPPTACEAAGVAGTCIATSACAAMQGYVSTPGLCPGAADIECCTAGSNMPPPPPPPPPPAPTCDAGGVAGTCIDTATCATMPGYVSTAGLCAGAANIECCTPPPACSVGGVAGTCIQTSACATMGGTSTAGLCPGAADIECCTQ
jgi:hypothetical protein